LFCSACLFVVMIGFGIALPVLPFCVERLALEASASQQSIVLRRADRRLSAHTARLRTVGGLVGSHR
jgi:hypothetical protein